MAAIFLPTKAGAKMPDIVGSVLRGVQLGLQARQLKVEENLAKDRYALALKAETRLNKESLVRTAQLQDALTSQKEQRRRATELFPLQKRKTEGEVTKAEFEGSPGFLQARQDIQAQSLKNIAAQIDVSKKRIESFGVASKSRDNVAKAKILVDEQDRLESLTADWKDLSPAMRASIASSPKSFGITTKGGQGFLQGLPTDDASVNRLDFKNMNDRIAIEAYRAGDINLLAQTLSIPFIAAATGSIDDPGKIIKDYTESLKKIFGPLVNQKGAKKIKDEKAKVEAKAFAQGQGFINDVWTAATKSGYSRKKAGDLLNNKKAMNVIRQARKAGMSFEEILKEIPR